MDFDVALTLIEIVTMYGLSYNTMALWQLMHLGTCPSA